MRNVRCILRPLILSLLPLAFLPVLRAETAALGPAPFLWTVEAEGLKPSWVFGTIHVTDEKVTRLCPQVQAALDKADAVYIEIPADADLQAKILEKSFLPDGKTLKDLLPADLYQKVEGMFNSKGVPFSAMGRFKIWVIATQLVMLDHLMDFVAKKPLDMVLFDQAGKAGKERGGIETLEEQIGIFESLSTEEQIAMLRSSAEVTEKYWKEGKSPLDIILEAYLTGEEAKLFAVLNESYDLKDPLNRKLWKLLIDDRNERMADRIAKMLKDKPGQSFFVGVGGAHLLGEKGVAELLRRKGFKVTRAAAPVQQETAAKP
ncbi:MAG: TraB/GumN family protein [Acidobacteria bacterium]|nr:TraB/GumN family protein [Acidobacteriota bacterium]